MPKKITKSTLSKEAASGIRSQSVDEGLLRFSFKLFDYSDEDVCPPVFRNGYTRALMDRLKSLSTWRVTEFTSNRSSSVRIHPIAWPETSRPNGFAHLNEQYLLYTPWQFSVSANADGRVHGILIDNCFYVVWLDSNHVVYS